jgi:N-acetylneuraminate synthase
MNYEELKNQKNPRAIFIAEAGINHDGDIKIAKKMVDAAAEAGADYVKTQSIIAEKLCTPNALKSSYIEEGSGEGESFRALLKRICINKEEHYIMKEHCDRKGIKFLSTAFDEESFDLLLDLGIEVVKVASGDLTNIPLLRYMASSKLPMIVSTGMATLAEIEEAVDAIANKEGNNQIVLMHCVSWYPAKIEESNLRYMETLRHAFGFPVGFSDHTLGINMSIAARAMGAVILEKHFTMDSKKFGPDHAASIEPNEMKQLVQGIREVERGLGSSVRQFSEKEIGQRKVHRRSIVANKFIKAGETFAQDNLAIKRPGIGIKPKHWDVIVGKKAHRDLKPEQLLEWSDIEI